MRADMCERTRTCARVEICHKRRRHLSGMSGPVLGAAQRRRVAPGADMFNHAVDATADLVPTLGADPPSARVLLLRGVVAGEQLTINYGLEPLRGGGGSQMRSWGIASLSRLVDASHDLAPAVSPSVFRPLLEGQTATAVASVSWAIALRKTRSRGPNRVANVIARWRVGRWVDVEIDAIKRQVLAFFENGHRPARISGVMGRRLQVRVASCAAH